MSATPARLSEELNTEAIAVWASDQGPGIGGLAESSDGQPSSVIATVDPERLEALLERHLNDDDEDEDEEGGELEDEERHYLWPQQSYANGDFDSAGDTRLTDLGFDLELLAEPLWALTEGDHPHESLGACFGID